MQKFDELCKARRLKIYLGGFAIGGQCFQLGMGGFYFIRLVTELVWEGNTVVFATLVLFEEKKWLGRFMH